MSEPMLIGVGAVYGIGDRRMLRLAGAILDVLRAGRAGGVKCALLSLRGGDTLGEAQAAGIAGEGIEDLSATYLSRPTPHLPDSQPPGTWPASFDLYDFALGKQMRRRKFRDACARADAVVVDGWVPLVATARLVQVCGLPVHAIAEPDHRAVRLASIPGLASVIAADASADDLAAFIDEICARTAPPVR